MSKLLRIELSGYDLNNDRVGTIYCRDKEAHARGEPWITPRIAKQRLRGKGAVKFKRNNIYPLEDTCISTETSSTSTRRNSLSTGVSSDAIARAEGSSTT